MDPLYLDYAATTPIRDEVREAMAPYAAEAFGNPSSAHRWGREAADALERAREEVADALGATPPEIRFVRGGTESDNLALLGWCHAQADSGVASPALATTEIEHHAVLEAAASAARDGLAVVTTLAVSLAGEVDTTPLEDVVAERPTLLSLMWVNNETGMILPVAEVGGRASTAGVTVHTDAAQAIGKVPIDLGVAPVHLLSATGHKIYGPKGTGLLFVRSGTSVAPLLHGGGQEGRLRPGTQDVAGAVGLATAVRLAVEERESEAARLSALRDRLASALLDTVEDVRINAADASRAPHVLSVGVSGVEDGNALLAGLDVEGIAVSGGSACMSGSTKGSHVIRALYGADDRRATVRYSFGRGTTASDVDRATAATRLVLERMRVA